MNKLMLIFTVLFLMAAEFVFAQDGLYKTHDDYLNNKLEPYEIKSLMHTMGRFSLVVKQDKKTIKIKLNPDDFWGYKRGGLIYRISPNQSHKLYEKGKICVYVQDIGEYSNVPTTISKGTGGEMLSLNQDNLVRLVADDSEILSKAKTQKDRRALYSLVIEYNKKHE